MAKKRWQTSQAIQQKIRSERERADGLIAESEIHNQTFRKLIKVPEPWSLDYRNAVDFEMNERDRKLRQAQRIEKTVIPKLIEKIGEFETNLLPCCGDDRSVPV